MLENTIQFEDVIAVEDKKVPHLAVSRVYKESQVLWGYRNEKEGVFYVYGEKPKEMEVAFTPVTVITENVESPAYATQVSNAGMTHRSASPLTRLVGMYRRVNTNAGMNWQSFDVEAYETRDMEMTLKLKGDRSVYTLAITREDLAGYWDTSRDVAEIPLAEMARVFEIWEPGFGTSSQIRTAEMVQKPLSLSYSEYFRRIGFSVQAHMTPVKNRPGFVTIKSLDKMTKRVKQTASSSTPYPFLEGFDYMTEKTIVFNREYMDASGEVVSEKAHNTIVYMKNAENVVLRVLISEDFTVRQEVAIKAPYFNSTAGKKLGIHEAVTTIDKSAVDGSHLISREVAEAYGLSVNGKKVASGEQFRWGSTVKGMAYLYPGLRKDSGFDIILFEGGIKGDVLVELRQGVMPFSILNHAREDVPNTSLKLSRSISAILQRETAMLEGINADTRTFIQRVMNEDLNAIRTMLSIPAESDVDLESRETEVDIDQLTAEIIRIGGVHALKSHTLTQKVRDLLMKVLNKFHNGSALYLENAGFKHMMVDPYSVVQFMRQGLIMIDKRLVTNRGIQEEHAVVSVAENGEEGFTRRLSSEACVLFRFPFLHENEMRKLNSGGNPFGNDSDARGWYEAIAKRGQMQGMIFYSLWDMNPEGQSGADFDGDQTLWTTNTHMVTHLQQQPLYLDYSLVSSDEGSVVIDENTYELVSGCPFPGDIAPVQSFLAGNKRHQAFVAEAGIELTESGLVFPEALMNDDRLLNLVGYLSSRIARSGLVTNDIGRFTNLGASIEDISGHIRVNHLRPLEDLLRQLRQVGNVEAMKELLPVYVSLKKEVAGYDNLRFYLASAIRWEIDKAKHGGAYRKHLPFLDMLSKKGISVEEVKEAEDLYAVSLQRLIFGTVTM